eukprot:gene6586-8748_t
MHGRCPANAVPSACPNRAPSPMLPRTVRDPNRPGATRPDLPRSARLMTDHTVRDLEALEALYGEVNEVSALKEISYLHPVYAAFVAAA